MADSITLSIDGGNALLGNIQRWGNAVGQNAQQLLESAATMMESAIDVDTPVLTGYLESRNQLTIDPGLATWSNDADYALFVILGHHTRSGSFVPPNDFVTPSWVNAAKWLQSALQDL